MRLLRGPKARRLAALAGAALAGAAQASVAAAGTDCPSVVRVADVAKGMTGTGYSVSEGRDPDPFSVKVLGVIPDGVAAGRDMIVVEASGAAIDRAGGIWYGMSGSPVYVGGRLLGAIAQGLTIGPSTIAGVTPAEDLVDVAGYPVAPPGVFGSNAGPGFGFVPLPPGVLSTIAKATGTPVGQVGSALVPLRLPFSASGLSPRGMSRLRAYVERAHLSLVPYVGSSASLGTAAAGAERLERGDNFVASLSYGDVSLSDVGTTTYVCNGKAVAFGHPLEFTGRTSMGANAGDAVAIVRDPAYGPFKLATIGGGVGRVDQDRSAGVRAVLGEPPATTPIRTSVTALDRGRTRDGATDVVLEPWTPFIAFLHLSENVSATVDTAGGGSSRLTWTLEGTRQDGRPWRLARSNRYSSRADISFESSEEIANELDLIASNPFEDVRFSAVRAKAAVEETVRQYRISRVLVSHDGGRYREVGVVRAHPGSRLALRVVLLPSDDSGRKVLQIRLVVPLRARAGGAVEVVGAPTGPAACFEEYECEPGARLVKSFEGLLSALRNQRRNNVLVGRLRLGMAGAVRDRGRFLLDRPVYGSKTIAVRLGCCGEPTVFPTESSASFDDVSFTVFGG